MTTSSTGVRIQRLELCNFRSFYGSENRLELDGKNLLLYGENGSGKSSLTIALRRLMEASRNGDAPKFERNIFAPTGDPAYVKLVLDNGKTCTWPEVGGFSSDATTTTLVDGAKANTFLDYRLLLKTYFREDDEPVNFFTLLVKGILADSELSDGRTTLADAWLQIEERFENIQNLGEWTIDKLREELETLLNEEEDEYARIAEQAETIIERGEEFADEGSRAAAREEARVLWQDKLESLMADGLSIQLTNFNTEFKVRLDDLQGEISRILRKLEPSLDVKLVVPEGGVQYNANDRSLVGMELAAAVKLHGIDLQDYHHTLNEARLSAIALAIYFASVRRTPDRDLKILILDDVLIGLDMSHRIPVVDLLNEEFAEHQIFVLTYDPIWYEIVIRRTDREKWVRHKLYSPRVVNFALTILEDKGLLRRAKEHYEQRDFKAAAVYVRSAFEVVLENFCERKGVRVKYHRLKKKLDSDDFWVAIFAWQDKPGKPTLIDGKLRNDVELHRWLTMNSIVHGSSADEFDREVKEAVELVERLEGALQETK